MRPLKSMCQRVCGFRKGRKNTSRKEVLKRSENNYELKLVSNSEEWRKDIVVSGVCRVGCVQTSPIAFDAFPFPPSMKT